jgi:ribosomal-protein-alanine N-acetyltransferase
MNLALETSRLLLRPFCKEDSNQLFKMNEDPLVIKYTGDGPFRTLQEAEALIRNYDQYKKYQMGRLSVIRKSDGYFLGWCGLKYHTEHEIVDIGYRFYRKYWGFGYATEAAVRCLKDGFERLQLNSIYAHVHKDNKASEKVLKKCGLKFVKNIIYDHQPAKLFVIHKEEFNS